MLLHNNFSQVLKEKGITLEELAKKINIPIEKLDEIYFGRKEFSQEILQVVSEYLNVPQKTLLLDSKKSIYENIGILLRKTREEKNMTLIELGKKSKVSYTHISEIERAKTCASLKTLEKLAKVLEIPTSYFFQLEESFTLGDKIKRLREKQNLTQVQLAEKIGVSLSLIGQIETGRVKPALDTLNNIANVFGVSMCYFLLSEKEEISLEQYGRTSYNNCMGKFNEIIQGMDNKDCDFVFDLLNVLKNHQRIGCQQYDIDPQVKELLDIISLLPNEDKNFVIENARWVLKKAKTNI